jgi:hypothetical protein
MAKVRNFEVLSDKCHVLFAYIIGYQAQKAQVVLLFS